MSVGAMSSAYGPQIGEATYDAQAAGGQSASGNTGYLGADAVAQTSAPSGSGSYGASNGGPSQTPAGTPAGLTPGQITGLVVGGAALAAGTGGVLYGGLRKGGWWRAAAPASGKAAPASGEVTSNPPSIR